MEITSHLISGKFLEHCLAQCSHPINVSSYNCFGGGITLFLHSDSGEFLKNSRYRGSTVVEGQRAGLMVAR